MANRFVDRTKETATLTGSYTFTEDSTTVSVTDGGPASELSAGDYIKPSTTNEWYKVESVTGDPITSVTLAYAFQQTTQSGVSAVKNSEDGTSAANAFCHPNQATTDEVRSAGDKIYMRRGQTHLIEATNLEFDEDGQPNNPITLMGDDGTGWSGETGLSKPAIDLGNKMNNQFKLNGGDRHWKFEDFEVKNNSYVAFYVQPGSHGCQFKNLKIHDNGYGLYVQGSSGILIEDCDLDDNSSDNYYFYYAFATIRGSTADGGPYGLRVSGASVVFLDDVTFGATTAHTTADIHFISHAYVEGRNVSLNSTTKIGGLTEAQRERCYVKIEDYGGTRLDNRAWYFNGTVVRNTTVTRSGGADSSAEGSPNSNCGSRYELQMFEFVLWAPASQKTYKVYMRASGWTTLPTSSECYIEAEYFSHATNADRSKSQSSQSFSANDTWTEFSVTVTPTAAGPLYLRGFLKKYESGAKIYVDVKPVVS